MDSKPFEPFVPAAKSMPELTGKAIGLGVLMAVALGQWKKIFLMEMMHIRYSSGGGMRLLGIIILIMDGTGQVREWI